jgi:hypothetical protein
MAKESLIAKKVEPIANKMAIHQPIARGTHKVELRPMLGVINVFCKHGMSM